MILLVTNTFRVPLNFEYKYCYRMAIPLARYTIYVKQQDNSNPEEHISVPVNQTNNQSLPWFYQSNHMFTKIFTAAQHFPFSPNHHFRASIFIANFPTEPMSPCATGRVKVSNYGFLNENTSKTVPPPSQ